MTTTGNRRLLAPTARAGTLTLLLAWVAVAVAADESSGLVHIAGETMGTTYVVQTAVAVPGLDHERLRSQIERILDEVDRGMSTYRSDSELSVLNAQRSTQWLPVSEDTLAVVTAALEVGRLSGGAFDVTIGPLVALWGFGPGPKARTVPSQAAIERASADVGLTMLAVRRQPPALRKSRPDVHIDLSGIAQGFCVDRVADHLAGLGVAAFLVEIGGEVRVRGRSPSGGPWLVAIERPSGDAAAAAAEVVLALDHGAVATSGDYRNFFEHDGRRYSHILDPRRGRPIEHGLVSVSVVDTSAMRADAWATALMVLGPEQGLELAEAHAIEALFIRRRGDGLEDFHTRGFEQYLLRREPGS